MVRGGDEAQLVDSNSKDARVRDLRERSEKGRVRDQRKKEFSGTSENVLKLKRNLRAFSSALLNVPNAKYLAHLAHQTQKWTLIKCTKCAKIMEHATVRSHFLECTDENAISIYCFFIHLSLSSLITLFPFFFSPLSFFLRHSYQPISSFILFSSHCCCFSLFYSASPRHLMPISDATPPDVDLCVFCCCFCF